MRTLVVRGPSTIEGTATLPGDKSISHRALMLGAVGDGETIVRNLAPGEDVASTIRCLESYGVSIDRRDGMASVAGRGVGSWLPPRDTLDCGNSGTTMRLLAGFAAHYPSPSVFDGDSSLRRRPMDRLVAPLGALGARVETTDGRPPVRVAGGRLTGAVVHTGISSAQVKSSVLFAALGAEGPTTVVEPQLSRDHTERILAALGARISESRDRGGEHRVELQEFLPRRFELDVAGDASSAAFLVAAGVLQGRVRIDGVVLNPTRCGFLDVVRRMGADLRWEPSEHRVGEPVGWIEAERSELTGVGVEGPLVPLMLDELPLVAVLATQSRGTTTVSGAAELAVKESDRIAATVAGLRLLGADIDDRPDGFVVRGPTPLVGTKVSSAGDHRIAMALAVAGLAAHGETVVEGFDCVAVSWPAFDHVLGSLGAEVELR